MEIFNLLEGELADEERPEGWPLRAARVGDVLGATRIGGSVYELGDGRQTFPYHYHHGVEEWLVVISGEPTLRTPDGERRLEPGDTVCFPSGARRRPLGGRPGPCAGALGKSRPVDRGLPGQRQAGDAPRRPERPSQLPPSRRGRLLGG